MKYNYFQLSGYDSGQVLHFFLVRDGAWDFHIGLPHHVCLVYSNWVTVQQDKNAYGVPPGLKKWIQTYGEHFKRQLVDDSIITPLGYLENIPEDIAKLYIPKYIGQEGQYLNYQAEEAMADYTPKFNSALASMKSACYETKINLKAEREQRIFVVAETRFP
jgi:hypothetical protein